MTVSGTLVYALPALIALVEAAEAFDMEQYRTIRTETIWSRLHDALASLDEALGDA